MAKRITAKSKIVDEITGEIASRFPGFGGGRKSWGNPLSAALSERAAMFAMGVPVREVVLATLKEYARRQRTNA